MPLFEESQRMHRLIIIAMLMAAIIFGIVILVLQLGTEIETEIIRVLWIAWALMVLTDGAIVSVQMVTVVDQDGIVVYCRPFRFLRKQVLWSDIERIYPRQYSPLAEYGGWGIRKGRAGFAYNMSGNQGIQLELKSGKRILIGTQQTNDFKIGRASCRERV